MTDTFFFSSYLYRMALECPTRLYFELNDEYPARQEDQELINHIQFNKRQLTELAHCYFPKGDKIDEGGLKKNARMSLQSLNENEDITLFNAVITSGECYYRCPILVKRGNVLEIFRVRSKGYNPHKHRFSGSDGKIYGKWKNYFTDLAFAKYVLKRQFPSNNVHVNLILPNKVKRTKHNLQSYFEIESDDAVKLDCSTFDQPHEDIGLLEFIEVDDYVDRILESKDDDQDIHPTWKGISFRDRIEEMQRLYRENVKYAPVLDMHCRTCPFRVHESRLSVEEKSGFKECWSEKIDSRDIEKGLHIFNLTGHGTRSFLQQNIYTLDKATLPNDWTESSRILECGEKINFEQRQALQILNARGEKVSREYVKNALFEKMRSWQFPLYFLDFEAANFAVPFRAGSRAYESLVFQYSCHVLQDDGSLQHYDWIQNQPGQYPNYEVFRNLKAIPGFGKGTILQYSPFEKQMFKEVRRILYDDIEHGQTPDDNEELMEWFDRILDGTREENVQHAHFVDMSELVRDYYYNREMDGSYGLKDVVAAIFETSDTLENNYSEPYRSSNFSPIQWWQEKEAGAGAKDPYEIIKERGRGINSGDEALMAFVRLQRRNLSADNRRAMTDALLKYCELDTLAMVMLYEHWLGMESA